MLLFLWVLSLRGLDTILLVSVVRRAVLSLLIIAFGLVLLHSRFGERSVYF